MEKLCGYVRRLNKSDAEAVFSVRREAYATSQQFKVFNFSYLEWDDVDDIAIVLGVFLETGELVASLRGEFINSISVGEERLHYSLDKFPGIYPSILLGRGATKTKYRNFGFNTLLRYYFLGLAIDFPFQSMISSVFEKAPRIGLLRDMNYKFNLVEHSTDQEIKVTTREYFVHLNRKDFLPAFQFMKNKFENDINFFPWEGLL